MDWKHEALSLYYGLLELGTRIEDGRVTVADLADECSGGEAAAMAAGVDAAEAKRRHRVEAEVIVAARAKFERALEALKGRVVVVGMARPATGATRQCAVGSMEGRTVNARPASQRGSAAA